ncbi:MAG TPA: peptidyl-prolyl cis-trans isomerase [Kofleriaceae bacterium]|nr:peptidyl-prolyl cis-trans isomerase [Kofleriaceae bacterium]
MRAAVFFLLSLVVACGGSPTEAPARPSGPPAAFVAPPKGAGDVIVAQVDGRPVWGSCVAAQLARGTGKTREVALAECIDFELLAAAAQARGLATNPEVIEATRTALVSRLVETGFEDQTATPEQLKGPLDAALAKNQARMNRPELRRSTHALAMVPETATPELDAKAKALAERIHAALATETGLFASHLEDTAKQLAKDSGVELRVEEFPLTPRDNPRALKEYLDALFAIPDVGRVSPVTHTKYGYHVILLTELVPAKQFTREEFVDKFFAEVRRKEFQTWVDGIIRALGLDIELDLAPLQAEGA